MGDCGTRPGEHGAWKQGTGAWKKLGSQFETLIQYSTGDPNGEPGLG